MRWAGRLQSNVELSSTRLSVVSGPMSSWVRQGLLLYQVQCRVELDKAFSCTGSNVELSSTWLSVVPGPMSSWNGLGFLLYQVQCLVGQDFPLYQVQCRVELDKAFRCTRSNVHVILVFCVLFPKLLSSNSSYHLRPLLKFEDKIFLWKIKMDQAVGIWTQYS